MKTIDIKVKLKALVGDRVAAKNNRRNDKIEDGKVVRIETKFISSISPRKYYSVYQIELDRRNDRGELLFIYAGDDGIIKRYKKEKITEQPVVVDDLSS